MVINMTNYDEEERFYGEYGNNDNLGNNQETVMPDASQETDTPSSQQWTASAEAPQDFSEALQDSSVPSAAEIQDAEIQEVNIYSSAPTGENTTPGNTNVTLDGTDTSFDGTDANFDGTGASNNEANISTDQQYSGVSPYPVNYNYADPNMGNGNVYSQQVIDNPPTPVEPKTKKRATIPTLIGTALLFGLVAGVCFQGVNEVAGLLGISGSSRDNAPIATTAPLTPSASNDTGETTADKSSSSTEEGQQVQSSLAGIDVSALVENSMPSIVAINSTIKGSGGYSFFGQYYESPDSTSCGSGFIARQDENDLFIVTNNHVISGADSISVQFIDEEIIEADVLGTNESADLAVLKVHLSDIPSATKEQIRVAALGDSTQAKVGEMVVAIGNALGYGQSVTVGYISAKERQVSITSETTGNSTKMTLLQTDAAINPGNSGGALLNSRGEVIGINSVKYASSEVEGMGFAIPISTATPIINELMNHEELTDKERGYLGVSVRTVTEEASEFNMPQGAYVDQVSKNGAADKAGILVGDIITAVNGIQITTKDGLSELVNSYRVGTKVKITLMRGTNGTYEEMEVTATLQGSESLDGLDDDTDDSSSSDASGNQTPDSDGNSGNNPDDGYEDYDPFGDYDPFSNFGYGW